jgi:hypothetical protein
MPPRAASWKPDLPLPECVPVPAARAPEPPEAPVDKSARRCPACCCEFVSPPPAPGVEPSLWWQFGGSKAGYDHPCPDCGAYHPATFVPVQMLVHHGMAVLAAVALVLALWHGTLTTGKGIWSLALIGPTVLFANWFGLRCDRNADREANRAEVPQGVRMLLPGSADPAILAPRVAAPRRWTASILLAMAVACVLIPSAEVARLIGGWPLNPVLGAGIVAPGETLHVEIPNNIESIQGDWSAEGKATLGSGTPLRLETRESSFGSWLTGSMNVRTNELAVHPKIWADVTLPDNPSLAGQSAKLKVQLSVSYPVLARNSTWVTAKQEVETTAEVRVAPKWGSMCYGGLAILGGLFGLVMLAGGSWFLGHLAYRPGSFPVTAAPAVSPSQRARC